jgi:two-component system response regulator RegA
MNVVDVEVESNSILLVDDDEVFRGRLLRAFKDRGFYARSAANAAEAIALSTIDSPEWAVLDLKMPGENGLELLGALLRLDPTIKVIILTGYGSIATAVDAMRLGACTYLPKPADVDDIIHAFLRAENTSHASLRGKTYMAPSLARTEWEHINRVLTDCDGNISETARRLGIHRRSLQRKLQKYPPVQ